MEISTVIPNFNGKKLLEKQLPILSEIKNIKKIIIVDDASTDESVDFIKKHFPNITLIEKVRNDGFATTVNIGVKAVDTELFLLLNTDVLPEHDFLDSLVPHFKDPKVAAIGCLDESFENGKTIERGRGVGRFEKGFLIHNRGDTDKTDTLWVSGGSSMLRTSIWREMHGMNVLYSPFYWEDIDYSYRVQKRGYKIAFEPKSKVKHQHQKGSILTQFSAHEITPIAYRNQILFVWLNIIDLRLLMNHMCWLPVHLFRSLFSGNRALLKGFVLAVGLIGEVWKIRHENKLMFRISDRTVLESHLR